MGYGRTAAKELGNYNAQLNTGLYNFLSGEIGQPGPQFSESLAPGASPLQETAFKLGTEFAGPDAQIDPALKRLLSGELAIGPDTFQNVIANPTLQQFNRDILPGIDSRLAARGIANSEARARALGQAGTDVNQQLLGARSQLEFQSRESALGRLGPAIEQALGMKLAKIGTSSALGGEQRNIAGQQSLDRYRQFLEAQPIFNPALGQLPLLLNQGIPVSSGTSQGGGGIGSALGTIAGAGIGSLIAPGIGTAIGASVGGAAGSYF